MEFCALKRRRRRGLFDPTAARRWAGEFATPVFLRRLREFVLEKMPEAAGAMAPVAAEVMLMEGMRELLRGSLGRSLQAMRPEDKLAAAWPVACGKAMAERGEVVGLCRWRGLD